MQEANQPAEIHHSKTWKVNLPCFSCFPSILLLCAAMPRLNTERYLKPWGPLKLYSIIRTGIMRKLDWLGVSRVHNNRAGNMPVMFCCHQLSYHISPRSDFEFQRQWNFATASFGDCQTCFSTIQRKLVSLKDHGHNPIALSGLEVLLQLGSDAEKGQLNVTWCIEILKQSGFLPLRWMHSMVRESTPSHLDGP